MNATVQNWFRLAFYLGVVFTIIFAGTVLYGAGEDVTESFAYAAAGFLWISLLGEVVKLFIVLWQAHKRRKEQDA